MGKREYEKLSRPLLSTDEEGLIDVAQLSPKQRCEFLSYITVAQIERELLL